MFAELMQEEVTNEKRFQFLELLIEAGAGRARVNQIRTMQNIFGWTNDYLNHIGQRAVKLMEAQSLLSGAKDVIRAYRKAEAKKNAFSQKYREECIAKVEKYRENGRYDSDGKNEITNWATNWNVRNSDDIRDREKARLAALVPYRQIMDALKDRRCNLKGILDALGLDMSAQAAAEQIIRRVAGIDPADFIPVWGNIDDDAIASAEPEQVASEPAPIVSNEAPMSWDGIIL